MSKKIEASNKARTLRFLRNLADALERGDVDVDMEEAETPDGLMGDMKLTMLLRGKLS